MSQTIITIPQFSTRSSQYRVASTTNGTTYVNVSNLTQDAIFGSLFTATASQVFLTTARPPLATSNTRFVLTDSSGSNSFVNLTVTAPSFTVSGTTNVLFQTLSRNLPIVLSPPSSNASGSVVSTIPGVSSTSFVCDIGGSNFVSNGYFVPSITPLGLTCNVSDAALNAGVITISGTPLRPRPASNYSYYVFDGSKNQMRTDFSIQILPPSFAYSNVSGAIVSGCNASVVLNYKVANEVRIHVDPVPQSIASNGPFPIPLTLSSDILLLSGVPTTHLNGATVRGVITPTYGNFSNPPLTIDFTMNPALELLNPPSTLTFYCNVPYTEASPITRFSAQYYPASPSQVYEWSISTGLSVSFSPTTGILYGTLGNVSGAMDVTVSSSSLTATTRFTLSAIPDSVTIAGPTVYTISQNVRISNLSFQATAASSSQVSQAFTYIATPPFTVINGLAFVEARGEVAGVPLDVAACNFTVKAINPQNVSATFDMSLIVLQDTVTILSSGLGAHSNASSALQVIQGRNLAFEYTTDELSYRAVSSSGNQVSNFPIVRGTIAGTGFSYSQGRLSGTPVVTGTLSFDVCASVPQGNSFAGTTLWIQSISDRFIRSSPPSLDFVLSYGSTSNAQLEGVLFSGLSVSGYTISGSNVAISPGGLLTLCGTTYQSASPFTIGVQTTGGTTVSLNATLTVNDSTLGSFVSPSSPATIVFSNQGDSYPLATSPSYTLTLSGGTGFEIQGTNLVRTTSSEVYAPILAVLQGPTNFNMPVRLATRTLTIDPLPNLNWIEYVPVSYSIATSGWPTPTSIVVAGIPPGLTWDPILGVLEGSPRDLTIQDSFVVYATDGIVSASRVVPYSVRAPSYLRGFSSPSAFTNYVRQLALVNGATHSINNIAQLPDPLIATQTGDYPPDVIKDVIDCRPECSN